MGDKALTAGGQQLLNAPMHIALCLVTVVKEVDRVAALKDFQTCQRSKADRGKEI